MADLVGERYEPLAIVARGDEGEVLRARDHRGGRQVALHVRHLVSPFELGALVTEALVLLDVERHPHLPLVREHFLHDDSYYLVMEWIEGVNLARVLRTEGSPGLPLGRVIDLLLPVAGALEHLHGQELPVVHQNVQPSSLILTGDGDVALAAFGLSPGWGLARPTLEEPPTPATDVHGLAVTAHMLLTGAPPGPGSVSRFSGLSDAEAEGVARALRRGFDPDPSQRPPTPSALLEELRAGASTLMLPPADPLERSPVWADFDIEPEGEAPPEAEAPPADAKADVDVDVDVDLREEAEGEAALWASLWAAPRIEATSWTAMWAGTDVVADTEVEAPPEIEIETTPEIEVETGPEIDMEIDLHDMEAGVDVEDVEDFEDFEAQFYDFEADPEAGFEADFEFDEFDDEVERQVVVEAEAEHLEAEHLEAERQELPDAGGDSAGEEGDRVRRIVRSNRLRGALAAVLALIVGVTVVQVRSARAERNELRRLQLVSVSRALAARVEDEVAAGRHEQAALMARQADLFGRQSGAGNAGIDQALRVALGAPHFSRVVATAKGGVWSLALSPDGSRLAVGGSTVRLVDPRAPQARGVALSGHLGAVAAVAFSPDGKTVASGGADPTVRLWQLDSPASPPALLEGHSDQVMSLAFGFTGRRLASASRDGTVRLWDLGTTPPTASLLNGHTGAVTAVAFSPDGSRLASAGTDGQVRIWDVASPAALATLPIGTPVNALAYSPDGRYLATGGDDGLVRLWDSLQPAVAPNILTGSGPVTALAFSADGSVLASGSRDHTVRLWPLSGEPPAVLTGHSGPVTGLAFSPSGDMVVSASADGSARRWRLGESSAAGALRAAPKVDRAVLSDLVCQEVGRNLSASEWKDAVGPGLPWQPTCAGLPRG
jgi:hypothetical protein